MSDKPSVEIVALDSFMHAFCEKFNVQLYCVIAKPSVLLDENGETRVDLISKSYMDDRLMSGVGHLVDMQIAAINQEKKKNKSIN